jgi:hypothetical protein
LIPGAYAEQVDITVQLDKTSGQASGTFIITEDYAEPFDCADGDQTVGALTLTPLAQSHDLDYWGGGMTGPDGCSTWEELDTNQNVGGLRDPFNFWDFFDVWAPSGSAFVKDWRVNIIDQGVVVNRSGSHDAGGTAPNNRNSDPLIPPTSGSGYHVSADRSSPLTGSNVWNLSPPDGQINIIDIGLVVAQGGHSCFAPP